jgi:uncharacterized protein Yka (UPF0111/DUF47 family)
MSSLTLPKWPAAPSVDSIAFRAWLGKATNPNDPGFGFVQNGSHRLIAPVAIRAELGRGCNQMMLDALDAGTEHLPERLSVVSERILDCLECAADADRGLVGELSRCFITPIDAEDLIRLSCHFTRAIELLARVASTASMMSMVEPEVRSIHGVVAEFFDVSAGAVGRLGERAGADDDYSRLMQCQQKAKALSREFFNRLLNTADTPRRAFAVSELGNEYNRLMAQLVSTARVIYHVALKNGA